MSSSDDDPVAWFRAQVQARLALAREAAECTDGHWWRRMTDAGHFDDGTLEQVGPLWAGEPVLDADGDVCGGEEIVVYDEGCPSGVQFDHIAANDPRDTIARCEAELAILDTHARVQEMGPADEVITRCVCQSWPVVYPCRTVRLLLSGYRFRPGWRKEWGPTPE